MAKTSIKTKYKLNSNTIAANINFLPILINSITQTNKESTVICRGIIV